MHMMKFATLLFAFGSAVVAVAADDIEQFTVDFGKPVGVIRKLNGLCNAAPLSNARTKSLDEKLRKLEIPHYRFHDAALENPGIELVDICRIFPLFHADADDPRNYDFEATDDYLKQVIDAGAEIEFRLGESIEHSKKQYFVRAPKDYAKWAEICVHIIRHYNEGWANGFKWNIRRWSIWEEPDTNPSLLTGAPNPMIDIYLPLYKAAVTRIKQEFPNLKVGGPQCCGGWNAKPFIEYCAKEKLPIDFLGFTSYARNPERLAEVTRSVRKLLDDNGFKKSEIVLAEWHFGPVGWGGHGTVNSPRYSQAWHDSLTGPLSTAYTAALLMHMQDEPMDYMYYYATKCGNWGLFDRNGHPYGSYWAMLAFAQLARGDVRVAAQVHPCRNWWVLASKETKTGLGRVMVTTMHSDDEWITLTLRGAVKPTKVRMVDPVHDFEESSDWKWDEKTGKISLHRNIGDSTIWLVDVETKAKNDGPMLLTLTFDDGTKDHIDVVLPQLAKRGWKGTFNIVTGNVGKKNHLTWDDIRTLQAAGHEIASHTITHPNLVGLLAKGETNEVRRQYRESCAAILRETGKAPRFMCHPGIAWNPAVDALCREEGMLPMSPNRHNFGHGTKAGTPTGIGAKIDGWLAEGRSRQDVLIHGVCPGGGWYPFDSEADFVAFLDEIADRERKGQVKVVPYAQFFGEQLPAIPNEE